MKTKSFIWVIAMFLCAYVANAQESTKSISLSFSPYGLAKSSVKLDEGSYTYNYKSIIGGSLTYESQLKGVSLLTELSYEQGSFDKYEIPAPTTCFKALKTEDFMHAAVTEYVGWAINPNKRIQFPIYVGIGGGYVKGGALHNFTCDVAAKFRVKFYITNKIGVFAGVNGRYSFGSKTNNDKSNTSKNQKDNLNIDNWLGTADAGVIFSF